jgi:hypothetical protein
LGRICAGSKLQGFTFIERSQLKNTSLISMRQLFCQTQRYSMRCRCISYETFNDIGSEAMAFVEQTDAKRGTNDTVEGRALNRRVELRRL